MTNADGPQRTQHNATSPILALPAELRNQIFQYVLDGYTIVTQTGIVRHSSNGFESTNIAFALPLTWRQVYAETSEKVCLLNTLPLSYEMFVPWTVRPKPLLQGQVDLIRQVRIEDQAIIFALDAMDHMSVACKFPGVRRILLGRKLVDRALIQLSEDTGLKIIRDFMKMQKGNEIEVGSDWR